MNIKQEGITKKSFFSFFFSKYFFIKANVLRLAIFQWVHTRTHKHTEQDRYIDMFGLVSLFNGISTILGYLMPKPFSQKNSSGTI